MGRILSPNRFSMSEPMLAAKYAQQVSAGHDRGYLKKLAHVHCLAHSELIEFSEGVRQRVRSHGDGGG